MERSKSVWLTAAVVAAVLFALYVTFGPLTTLLLAVALAGLAALFFTTRVKAIFVIPELRQKILLTLMFLAIYRIGYAIPLPFIDQEKMPARTGGAGGALGNI